MFKNPKVSFGSTALKNLVKAEESCVTVKPSFKRTLTLLPVHLTDFKTSLKEILNSRVTTYDDELNGIILGHKNVKVVDLVQVEESGHIKVKIMADIYIFRPTVGCTLKGVVNKKGGDHVSCLVHKVFNASILRPYLHQNQPSSSSKATLPPASWRGSHLRLGEEILFRVDKLDFSGRLPYIRGHLLDSGSVNETENRDEIDSGIGCGEGQEEESLHMKKKKKKKDKKTATEGTEKAQEEEREEKSKSLSQVLNRICTTEGVKSPLKGILKRSTSSSSEALTSPPLVNNGLPMEESPKKKNKEKKKKKRDSVVGEEMQKNKEELTHGGVDTKSALIEQLMASTRLSLRSEETEGKKTPKRKEKEEGDASGRKRKRSEGESEGTGGEGSSSPVKEHKKKHKKKKCKENKEKPQSIEEMTKALLAKVMSEQNLSL